MPRVTPPTTKKQNAPTFRRLLMNYYAALITWFRRALSVMIEFLFWPFQLAFDSAAYHTFYLCFSMMICIYALA